MVTSNQIVWFRSLISKQAAKRSGKNNGRPQALSSFGGAPLCRRPAAARRECCGWRCAHSRAPGISSENTTQAAWLLTDGGQVINVGFQPSKFNRVEFGKLMNFGLRQNVSRAGSVALFDYEMGGFGKRLKTPVTFRRFCFSKK